jgi:hypothetical protein
VWSAKRQRFVARRSRTTVHLRNKESVIRSFRLDNNTATLLLQLARRKQTSENAIVLDLIQKHLQAEPLSNLFQGITVSKGLFQLILGQTNRDGIEIAGSEIARKELPLVFEILQLERGIQPFVRFLKTVLCDICHWFAVAESSKKDELLLIHDLGIRWSLFLKSFLAAAVDSELHQHMDLTFSENVVKIRFADFSQRILMC